MASERAKSLDRTIFLCRILHDFSVQNRRHITSTITALLLKSLPVLHLLFCSHSIVVLVVVVVVVAATNTVKLFNVSRRGALDCRHGKFLSGCLLHKLIHSKKKELETGKAALSLFFAAPCLQINGTHERPLLCTIM